MYRFDKISNEIENDELIAAGSLYSAYGTNVPGASFLFILKELRNENKYHYDDEQ